MSIEGLCAICETSTAEHSCDLCGRLVCETHFQPDHGVCTECESTTDDPSGGDESQRDRPDGVDEYRF